METPSKNLRTCPECARRFKGEMAVQQHRRDKHSGKVEREIEQSEEFEPHWEKKCIVCDATPTVGTTDLCGPCCFGEADTMGGNW